MTTTPSGRTTSTRRTEAKATATARAKARRAGRAAVAVLLVLVALPGCGGGDDDPPSRRERVFVVGPELENELGNIQDAFAPFEADTGIEVVVTGSSSFEERIGTQIVDGHPPDIGLFPQPGLLRDQAGDVVAVPDELADRMQQDFDHEERLELVTLDDDLLGVPVSADLKSLVWYSPEAFALGGYEEPTTLDDFEAMAENMADLGRTPFCLGLESGVATGWPLTDWIEDYLLRIEGPEVYDQWWNHEIPFDDPRVVAVAERVVELLGRDDAYVLDGLPESAERATSEAGRPILTGECMMYRMANNQGRDWPPGTDVGPDGDVNAFYLPGVTPEELPALTAGIYAAAFSDRRAVMATLEYIASPEFGRERATNDMGGFLSPHRDVDPELYESPVDRYAAEVLADAAPVRFDATDLMPGPVGSDAVWDAMVDIVQGDITVADAFAEIERNWPPPAEE
jgi:alpha-glucoside transport system substrate-binding protein